MRVLLVEDEVPLADAVARGLRRLGMNVDVAGSVNSRRSKKRPAAPICLCAQQRDGDLADHGARLRRA